MNATTSSTQRTGPAIELRLVLPTLLRHWRVVLLSGATALLLGLGALALVPTRFQSGVQVLVFDPQRPGMSAFAQGPASGREYDAVAMNSEVELLKSTSLAIRVARELRLFEDPEFQPGGSARWLRGLQASLARLFSARTAPVDAGPSKDDPSSGVERRIEQAAAILRGHVDASRIPTSYVLVVSASARSPQMARLLATTLVNAYLADQREVEQQALGRLAEWLTGKISALKDQIAGTGMAVERLRISTGTRGAEKGSLNDQQVADLNAQLSALRADIADKAARIEQVRRRPQGGGWPEGALGAVASPPLTELHLQRSAAARLRDQLRQRLGDRHAEVVALDAQLSALDKSIDDEASRAFAELQSGYDVSAGKAAAIEASLQRLRTSEANPDASVRLQELQRTAETDSRTYDGYLARLEEVESLRSLGAAGQRIISPASMPATPAFPPRRIVLAASAVLGLAAAAVAVIYLRLIRGSIRNAAGAESCLGYPVVCRIPFAGRAAPSRRRLHAPGAAARREGMPPPQADADADDELRRLRIKLRGPGAPRRPQVVLVTSALRREGRSTVAALLAASSAAARQKTVLLACDAGGSQGADDRARGRPGLTDVLAGAAELAHVATSADRGCDVISAGRLPEEAPDLLTSGQLSTVLDALRESYEFVVIDGPPVLRAGESLALAESSDRILVVVDPNHADDRSVTRALHLLEGCRDRVAGFVFNDARASPATAPSRSRAAAAGLFAAPYLQRLRYAATRTLWAAGGIGRRREL